MSLDLLIPFGILLALVVYLIYSRTIYEKEVVSVYEDKFEQWKEHTDLRKPEVPAKELIGLLYRTKHKYEIEVLKDENIDRVNIAKISIKGQE